jgi:hypothetical protein
VEDQEIDFKDAVLTQESSVALLQDRAGMTAPIDDRFFDAHRESRRQLEQWEERQNAMAPPPPSPDPGPGQPQAEETPDEPERDPYEILSELGLRSEPRSWTLGLDSNSKTYWQRELSFGGKLEIAALIGEVVDKAMSGDSGFSVGALDELVDIQAGSDWTQANTLLRQIARFTRYMPDFVEQGICILLAIPLNERAWAREMMGHPKSMGGFSDDEFMEIIETAIDQNYADIEDLITGKIGRLRAKAQAHLRVSRNRRSKSSRR